jgi:methionyl-tRNA synthetase
MLLDRGEIEKRSYAGWYCTPDERFWTEKDLVGGNCPDCGRPVEQIHEENYFFLMSKYQERLTKYIDDNPDYILPETRKNEVLGFLKHNTLGDLCISRPKQRGVGRRPQRRKLRDLSGSIFSQLFLGNSLSRPAG